MNKVLFIRNEKVNFYHHYMVYPTLLSTDVMPVKYTKKNNHQSNKDKILTLYFSSSPSLALFHLLGIIVHVNQQNLKGKKKIIVLKTNNK